MLTSSLQVVAPHFGQDNLASFVKEYENCEWRSDTMSLLEYLRKSTEKGGIAGWLRALHKQRAKSGAQQSLADFANNYAMRGEQVVALTMFHRMNDKYFGQWAMMNIPFRSLDEFALPEVRAKVPSKHQHMAVALVLCRDRRRVPSALVDFWGRPGSIEKEMECEARTADFIRDFQAFVVGQTKLLDDYMQGRLNKDDEASAMTPRDTGDPSAGAALEFNLQQLLLQRAIEQRVDLAMAINRTEDMAEADSLREEAAKTGKPVICLGPPGTGKTTVVGKCIANASEKGAIILFALPTAQLASRMRARFPDIDVDTCAAAFQFHKPESEALPLMTAYELVVIDEVSLLDQDQFERIMRLWRAAEQVPALVFLGDRYQLPGVGAHRPWESRAWSTKVCKFVELHHSWRCKDERFGKILQALRTSVPDAALLGEICRGHKAWSGAPTVEAIRAVRTNYPETTIVTCTRRGAATINRLALQALHPLREPLAILPGDPEEEPANFQDGNFRTDRRIVPSQVPIHKGMLLYLTKNIRKDDDFVNGMLCTVETFHEVERTLRLRTQTGRRLAVTPWTDVEHGKVTYYPIRLGCSRLPRKRKALECARNPRKLAGPCACVREKYQPSTKLRRLAAGTRLPFTRRRAASSST